MQRSQVSTETRSQVLRPKNSRYTARRPLPGKRERLRPRKIKAEAESLKKKIAGWATENRQRIVALHNGAEFPYLEQFSDLLFDSAGDIFGLTEGGGNTSECTGNFSGAGCGVVFELTP